MYNDNDNVLIGLKKTNLKVYPVGTDISTMDASTTTLRLGTPVSTLITTDDQPVIVVARSPISSATTHLSSQDHNTQAILNALNEQKHEQHATYERITVQNERIH